MYILVKGNIAVPKSTAANESANNANKKATFKNCALFLEYDIEYNYLIEYRYIFSKISGSLWQYYRD